MDIDLEHDRIYTFVRAANRHDSRGLRQARQQMVVALLLLLLGLHNVMSSPHAWLVLMRYSHATL